MPGALSLYIKAEAHHDWLTLHMATILILQVLVPLSGESGKSMLVWGHQTGYNKMQSMYGYVWYLNTDTNYIDFGTCSTV